MQTLGKIPTTVFTGFLGAGKTSLIRNLLRHAHGRRIALIVNEFGDIGVDRELLLGCGDATCGEDDIVELANGCICCTVADDFVPTMQRLLARVPPPEHVVIETSGLALPKPLLKAFQWPEIRTRVTVDGVIAVVDAAAVRDGVFASTPAALEAQRAADPALDHDSPLEELFEEQLGAADLVVLNKADLLAEADWAAVEARVRLELRPGVRCVRSDHARLPAEVLVGLAAAAETDLASRPSHHDDGEDPKRWNRKPGDRIDHRSRRSPGEQGEREDVCSHDHEHQQGAESHSGDDRLRHDAQLEVTVGGRDDGAELPQLARD